MQEGGWAPPEALAQPPQSAGDHFTSLWKGLAGEAAQIGDMLLTTPNLLVKTGAEMGGTIGGLLAGETPKEAYAGGLKTGADAEQLLKDWHLLPDNPLGNLMKAFGSGEAYDASKVAGGMEKLTSAMEKAGQWTEDKTGGKIPAESVQMMFDSLMSGLTIAGGRAIDKRMAEGPKPEVGLESRGTYAPEETQPSNEAAPAKKPLSYLDAINESTGVSADRPSTRAAKARVTQAFKEPAEGSDYTGIEESVFRADERARNRELWAGERLAREADAEAQRSVLAPIIDTPKTRMTEGKVLFEKADDLTTALDKQREGKAFDMTAEERIALRDFGKRTVDFEKGGIDPKLLAGLGAASLGLAIGSLDEDSRNAMIGMGVMLLGHTKGEAITNVLADAKKAVAEAKPKIDGWPDWKYSPGEVVTSGETGRTYKIQQKWWDTHSDKPVYVADDLGGGGARTFDAEKLQKEFRPASQIEAADLTSLQESVKKASGLELEFKRGPVEGLRSPDAEELMNLVHEGKPVELTGVLKDAEGKRLGHVEVVQHAEGGYEVRDIMLDPSVRGRGLGPAIKQGLIDAGIDLKDSAYTTEAGKRMNEKMKAADDPTSLDFTQPSKLGGVGKSQGGAIDPRVFEEVFRDFKDSVVRNKDGVLVPLYHGGAAIEEGMPNRGAGNLGDGLYLSESPATASRYAAGSGNTVYPAYVRLANPMDSIEYFRRFGPQGKDRARMVDSTKVLREEGYDGVVQRTPDGRITQAVVFEPDAQVKSALSVSYQTPQGLARQRGAASPELLKKIALVGGSAALAAYVADDRKLSAAVLGAIGGLTLSSAAGRAGMKEAGDKTAAALGMLSTEIKNISEPLHHRMIQYELGNLKRTHDELKIGDSFFTQLEKVKGPTLLRGVRENPAADLELAITTNDFPRVQAELRKLGKPALAASWPHIVSQMKRIGAQLDAQGLVKGLREDYFPRIVTDYNGLKAALNPFAKSELEAMLKKAEDTAIRSGRGGLDEIDRSQIINSFLQKKGPTSYATSFTKGRQIDEVTKDLAQFYANPIDAYHRYIYKATQLSEAAKFFGRDLKHIEVDGKKIIDYDASIGGVLQKELAKGEVTPDQIERARGLLQARFLGGERPMWNFWQDVKNITAAGLLGNMVAAVGQYADIGPTMAVYGVRPTLESAVAMAKGTGKVSASDLGLINHVAEEFVSTRPSAKIVNWAFSHSLLGPKMTFAGADMAMKDLRLNAALRQGKEMALKGDPELARRYGKAFGDEYPQLVKDLQRGEVTAPVRDYLFHELSRTQPISKMEMPEWALKNPNGRLLYSMKSWALKQADFVRREAYQEIKAGNRKRGVEMLLRYGMGLGLGGATVAQVQNWMLGRDTDLEASDVFENMAKTFALNAYTRDRVEKGKVVEAAIATATPPYKMYDEILQRDPKIVRYLPDVGPLLYAHAFGGKEKFAKAEQARKNAQARAAAH